MGSAASAHLYDQIIKSAQKKYGAKEDHQFPEIILYNLPLVGLESSGVDDSNTRMVRNQLVEGVQKLEKWGSDFIIIACNTAHLFYPEMQNAISIPIINILEETAKEVKNFGCDKVGVLSSISTYEWGLYKKVLEKRNIQMVPMNGEQLRQTEEIISNVMSGTQKQSDKEVLKRIVEHFVEQGANGVILGCTELPLVLIQDDTPVNVFDTTNILADAALKNWAVSIEEKLADLESLQEYA